MGPDQVVELMRGVLREAMILAAPILLVATAVSLVVSFAQTITSLQDQTLSTVPRVVAAGAVALAGMPWFLARLTGYTLHLLGDLRPFAR